MPVNPKDVVAYVRANQAALNKAAGALAEHASREKAAASAAVETSRILIEHGYVKAAAESTLAGALASHEKTLLLLTKFAKLQADRAPAAIGEPVGGSDAAEAGQPTMSKSAADLAFSRRLLDARRG